MYFLEICDYNSNIKERRNMLVELNSENFEQETQSGLKLVEFYTTWCGYCRNQRIELQDFEQSKIWIGLVDADESPEIAQKYNITGYPTFILLKDGKQTAEISGFHSKEQLLNNLMAYL